MHAAQEEVDAEVRDKYAQEGHDAEIRLTVQSASYEKRGTNTVHIPTKQG